MALATNTLVTMAGVSQRAAPSRKTSSPPNPLPSAKLSAIRNGAGIGNS